MPPLLPEYLNQPAQVVLQSQQTDWLALMAAGLFTLVGAGLGAWYGGRAAYRNTVKAQHSIIQRQKLEEAMSIILDLEIPIAFLYRKMCNYRAGIGADIDSCISAAAKVKLKDVHRLTTLLQIYDKELYMQASNLNTTIKDMRSGFMIAEALGEKTEVLYEHSVRCDARLIALKESLMNRLKL